VIFTLPSHLDLVWGPVPSQKGSTGLNCHQMGQQADLHDKVVWQG